MGNGAIHLLINSLKGGGAEVLNLNLHKKLPTGKLFLLEEKNDFEQNGTEQIEYLKKDERFKSSLLRYLKTPFLAKTMAQKLEENSKVVVSLPRAMMVAYFLKKYFKKKSSVIYWCHYDPNLLPSNSFFRKIYLTVFKEIYSVSDGVIVNSRKARADFAKLFKIDITKIKSIYNHFDIESIVQKSAQSLSEELQSQTKNPYLIAVGRLDKVKRVHLLIDVFNEVQKKNDNLHFLIIGEGEERKSLELQIERLGLGDKIHLLGFRKNPFQLIANSVALIFASEQEGFGNVIVEGLACSTPVLAADIDNGPREILAPKTPEAFRTGKPEFAEYGVLLPTFHKEKDNQTIINQWVETIEETISKKELLEQYRKSGIERANAFDSKILHPQFMNFINSIN